MALTIQYVRCEWYSGAKIVKVAPRCWFSVACTCGLLMLDGFARRKDAEIAAEYLQSSGAAAIANAMSCSEADDYIAESEPEWIEAVGKLLQW